MVTSPPYAEQRAGRDQGIPEEDYPDFMVQWMDALRPKLTKMARFSLSFDLIFVVASSRTTCCGLVWLCGDAGWHECEELIWYKTKSPPLGSKLRPRGLGSGSSGTGSVLSRTATSKRAASRRKTLGFVGSTFAEQGVSEKTGWIPVLPLIYGEGVARISDVFLAPPVEDPGRGPADVPASSPCRPTDQKGQPVLRSGLGPFARSNASGGEGIGEQVGLAIEILPLLLQQAMEVSGSHHEDGLRLVTEFTVRLAGPVSACLDAPVS